MQIITNSDSETKQLAKKLAKKINSGVIALSGNLGAGKTTFTQGFANCLGIKDKIISPTFVLIKQHQIPNQKKTLYHIDLYRLKNSHDIKELGIEELLNNQHDLVLIEWAEKIKHFLPKNTIQISIKNLGGNQRQFQVENLI